MKELQDNQCPRCGGSIPNFQQPGAYPGALSRLDDETEICSQCGVEEAIGSASMARGWTPIRTIDGQQWVPLEALKVALGWFAYRPDVGPRQ